MKTLKIEKTKCKHCDKIGERIKIFDQETFIWRYEGNWCKDFSHREKIENV